MSAASASLASALTTSASSSSSSLTNDDALKEFRPPQSPLLLLGCEETIPYRLLLLEAFLRRHAHISAKVLPVFIRLVSASASSWNQALTLIIAWCAGAGTAASGNVHLLPASYRRKLLQAVLEAASSTSTSSLDGDDADSLDESLLDEIAALLAKETLEKSRDENNTDDLSEARRLKTVSYLQVLPGCEQPVVTLVNVANDVLAGGTGLAAWTAGFALGADAANGTLWTHVGENSTVLELGAGTGAASVAICRYAPRGTRVFITDGDEDALANLRGNLECNAIRTSDGTSTDDDGVVTTRLAWPDVPDGPPPTLPTALHHRWNDTCSAGGSRLVLGADITYEPASFPGLCRLLHYLLVDSKSTAILYCTERNADTMSKLRDAIAGAHMTVASEHAYVGQHGGVGCYVGVGTDSTEVVRVLYVTCKETRRDDADADDER
ncbi:hypothetical protein PPROV_001093500 [Pycnococcus provasolii]|uniref:Calmodulin-lysine N-methyltransferase n=1 Tax=Pycnococcus provasolii TaxID=41880 RepID=A0A830I543_9CHLO|nr:hypothetical protein PPROV_001093500 [Pycnococcus provasolii]